jgi:predicted transcriptional regulator
MYLVEKDESKKDSSYLFFIFSGIRFHILLLLTNKSCSFTELKNRLYDEKGITTAPNNLEHHITFLLENKIIKKEQNLFHLTSLGLNLFDLTCSMQFVWKMKEYFVDHNIGDLPLRFRLSLGIFNNIQIIRGHPKIMRRLIEMYNNADKFIYNILYEIEGINEITTLLKAKLENNKFFHIKNIFGENSIFDSIRQETLSEFKIFKTISKIEQKMLTKIKISLVVTDKSAFIVFPKYSEENPDMNYIIYGEDKEFNDWCLNYFYHSWDNADLFDEKRLFSMH